MTDASTLLREYVTTGSESAFRELVHRYINLVYSTALRFVDGNAQAAEDIAQTVFIDLARKAHGLATEVMLGGWLHRRTCHVAASVRRSEQRRQARERQAMELDSPPDHTQANLAQVAPVLDEAINQLANEDRAAILLRFFEQRDFRSVGEALGTKEDAARMRVGRALDKLHDLLSRRGVSLSAAALGTALTAGAASGAPAGLASSIAGTALTSAAVSGGVSLTLFKLIAMTKLKLATLTAVLVAAVATPVALQYQSQVKLRAENRLLRQQLEEQAQLAADNERLSNLLHQATASQGVAQAQENELLKLRGQVGVLKKQLTEAAAAKAGAAQATSPATPTSEPDQKQKELLKLQFIAKMNYAKNWMLAFYQYAEQNQGQCPNDFRSAASYLPDEAKDETLLATNQFEILYRGSLNTLTNPATIIVLRESEALASPEGGWLRTYGFADGHSELHKAADGNFGPWEAQHLVFPPLPTPAGQ